MTILSTLESFLDTTPKTATLYTVGYGMRTLKQLVNLLINAEVEQVIDVRRNVFSENPDFNGHQLNLGLRFEAYGFRYQHYPTLGNPWRELYGRDRNAWKLRFFSRFTAAQWQVYRGIITQSPTALMCAEKNPRRCHRSELAVRFAVEFNLKVVHL